MISWLTSASEALLLIPVAVLSSWLARVVIRRVTRRAVRTAQRSPGRWRVRLDRLGDNGQAAIRKRQRADAVARMFGQLVTIAIFGIAGLVALDIFEVDLLFVISSAGFLGLALALSGQDLVKDLLAGTRALLEDRYAVGDEVIMRAADTDIRGAVDLIGAASVRLRTPDGATWHTGHNSVVSVTNLSQLPAVSDIEVPVGAWTGTDEGAAADRLVGASNDVGLTGVVFLRHVETHTSAGEPDAETVKVRVKTNRPLSTPETDLVRAKLLNH